MTRLSIDPSAPDSSILMRAAAAIQAGELVIIPTDTLYGLAADPFNAAAVRRVFRAKGRDARLPVPLIAASRRQMEEQIGPLPVLAARLASTFWPGPLTLVVPAPAGVAGAVTGETGTVAVRVPDHAVARGLCDAVGRPLTATSANLSGQAPSADPDRAVEGLEASVAVLLDAGMAPGGPPSTVVDVRHRELRLVRAGAIPWEEIQRCVIGR